MTTAAIGDYSELRVLRQLGDTLVLRATSLDGRSVIIKTHAQRLPTVEARARLRREYDSAMKANHRHLDRARELIDQPSRSALVLDDHGGVTLAELLGTGQLDIERLVKVAIDAGSAAVALHAAGLVHTAIDADHIEVSSDRAALVDLYDAALIGAVPRRRSPGRHLAPEQSARGIEPADPASDQYALACTIAAAFEAEGCVASAALGAVLSRARQSKPVDRYRSMIGFVADLRRAIGAQQPFEPGAHDIALTWRDPSAMVGRDEVLVAIDAAIDAAASARDVRIIVVRGAEGSGCSMLLRTMCARLSERGILNGLGCFDPGGADPPLRAPMEAMRQIVAQVLAGPEPVVDALRVELSERLGADIALAEQIIPSLAHLVPVEGDTAAVSPAEMVRRAERAVLISLGSIARHAGPLVVALDDADHADVSSAMALHVLGRRADAGPMVLVLGTHDDDGDEGDGSVLAPALQRLHLDGTSVTYLELAPLNELDVRAMVAEGTGSHPDDIAPLALAVWHRTSGVPELVINDVWSLAASNDLAVDVALGRWAWTETAITGTDSTTLDDAAVQRLQRLDETVSSVVVAAALSERAASDDVLADALAMDPNVVRASIDRAVDARILVRRPGIDARNVASCADGGVRRAALAMIDDDLAHKQLALRLAHAVRRVDGDGPDDLSVERRFEVVRLMSLATDLLETDAERDELARMCGQAARDVHQAAGYQTAFDLQRRALDLLGERGWRSAHTAALTFDLHLFAAEHAMMLGQTSVVDELMSEVAAHRPTAEQRVRALRVHSSRWWTRQDTAGGLAEARALLRELGEPMPDKPTWADVGREFVATRLALHNVEPEMFLDSPRLDDERLQAVTETMLRCVHLAYVSDPITHTVLALRGTRLTVRHGVSDGSGYFLTAYAMLSCAFRTDVERALRFGRVGLQLADGKGGTLEAMVRFAYNGFVRHWGEPLSSTIEPMLEQHRITVAAHERGYGLTAGTFAVLHSVLAAQPLHAVDALALECSETFARLDEPAFQLRVAVVRQVIAELRDGTKSRDLVLDGELFSSSVWLAAKRRHNELALMVHTMRATIAACRDDRELMRQSVAAGTPMLRTAPGQAIVGQHWFLAALAAADAFGAATTRRERSRERLRVERAVRWLRSWSRHAPANVEHRIVLVEAVMAEASQQTPLAMERFDRAVHLARERDALADLGIAAQRAAAFHLHVSGSTLGHHYVQLAHDAWQAWGATAMADSVIDRFPGLSTVASFGGGMHRGGGRWVPETVTAGFRATTANDTFAQASLLIGEELEVHVFLERFVEILIRHTSATRAYIVLQTADGPKVDVAAHRFGDSIIHPAVESRLPGDHADLCIPALSYSLRTRELLALVDPAGDNRFRSDARLRERAPRAMLCLPIGRLTATNGVLVMESDTYTHAFDADTVESLRALSAQAIAAVENVRLTSDVSSLTDEVAHLRDRATELTHLAEIDPLTGVANRAGLQSGFQTAMKTMADGGPGSDRQLGVLFCDLDGFKAVNDRHGHGVGDALLQEVAARLRRVVRAGDIVARVGGDEFVVLSVDVPTSELRAISERAADELRRPFELPDGPRVTISASIGVARAAVGTLVSTDDVDALLQIADQAMYRAKSAGKDQVTHS